MAPERAGSTVACRCARADVGLAAHGPLDTAVDAGSPPAPRDDEHRDAEAELGPQRSPQQQPGPRRRAARGPQLGRTRDRLTQPRPTSAVNSTSSISTARPNAVSTSAGTLATSTIPWIPRRRAGRRAPGRPGARSARRPRRAAASGRGGRAATSPRAARARAPRPHRATPPSPARAGRSPAAAAQLGDCTDPWPASAGSRTSAPSGTASASSERRAPGSASPAAPDRDGPQRGTGARRASTVPATPARRAARGPRRRRTVASTSRIDVRARRPTTATRPRRSRPRARSPSTAESAPAAAAASSSVRTRAANARARQPPRQAAAADLARAGSQHTSRKTTVPSPSAIAAYCSARTSENAVDVTERPSGRAGGSPPTGRCAPRGRHARRALRARGRRAAPRRPPRALRPDAEREAARHRMRVGRDHR